MDVENSKTLTDIENLKALTQKLESSIKILEEALKFKVNKFKAENKITVIDLPISLNPKIYDLWIVTLEDIVKANKQTVADYINANLKENK